MTEIPIPGGTDPSAGEYFANLRALKIGDEEGWFRYVAGDLKTGRHVVELPSGLREVYRSEAFWWCLGLGDGSGHGDLILDPVEVPEMLTEAEAADLLYLSKDGVTYRVRRGQLHVVFPGGRRRLIAAQVRSVAGGPDAGAAAAEWQRLLNLWPPSARIEDLPGYTAPAGGVVAVPETMPEGQRQIFALTEASAAGLILYRYVESDRDVYGVSLNVEELAARRPRSKPKRRAARTRRELPRRAVLPWLLGVADRAGRPGVVAYRPGLT